MMSTSASAGFAVPGAPASATAKSTGSVSIAALQRLHSDIVNVVFCSETEGAQLLQSIRARLPNVSTLSLPDQVPDASTASDAQIDAFTDRLTWLLESFIALLEITQLPVGQRANLLASLIQDLLRNKLVDTAISGMAASARNHEAIAKAMRDAESQAQPTGDAGKSAVQVLVRRKRLLASLADARSLIANVIHAAVKMATPDASDIKSLGTALSQLPIGDVATVPLVMATLSAIRAISEAGTDAVTAAAAPFSGPGPRADARHADLEQLRNQLNAVNFSHQPALKSVLELSLAVAIASSTNGSAKITQADTKLAQDALTSDAIPWLLTHVTSNLPRKYDPLSLPLDTIYRSVSKDAHPIVRYPLSDRSQDLARRELANLVANAIQRLPNVMLSIKENDERMLRDLDAIARGEQADTDAPVRRAQSPPPSGGRASSTGLVRVNYELFALLAAFVFEGHVQDSQAFWTGELKGFVGMPVYHRRLQTVANHLVAATVTDVHSASRCYERMAQAELAHAITWSDVFDGLRHFVEEYKKRVAAAVANQGRSTNSASSPRAPSAAASTGEVAHMSPPEADLVVSLLRVLRQVVRFDGRARRQMLMPGTMNGMDVLSLLFALLTCTVSVRVKAALIDTIAAFVAPGTSLPAEDHQYIAERVWSYMENIAMVPQASRAMGSTVAGLVQELEDRESKLKTFPVTAAYLSLVKNLASVETTSATSATVIDAPRIGGPSPAAAIAPAISPFSLVDNLGSSHRTPGPAPYYNYMLHDVFLKAALREYTDPRELWAITSTSLGAVLRCLQDFDAVMKDVLLSMASGNARAGPHVSARLAMAHPAFFMLNEILDGKPLLGGILGVISRGRATLVEEERQRVYLQERLTVPEPTKAPAPATANAGGSPSRPGTFSASTLLKPPAAVSNAADSSSVTSSSSTRSDRWVGVTESNEFTSSLLLAFRVIYQVLLMQSKFLHELLPRMWSQSGNAGASMTGSVGSSKRELDRLLSTRQSALIDIVSLVNGPLPELGIMSVKILASLSMAPGSVGRAVAAASPIVTVLSMSESGNVIVSAYEEQFRLAQEQQGSDLIQLGKHDEVTVHSVRQAILQLVAYNLRMPQIPSLGHFILGLTKAGQLFVGDKVTAEGTLLSSILALALPLDENEDMSPLFAERAYEIVCRLISNPATSATSAMLMSQGYFQELIRYWFAANKLPAVKGGVSPAVILGQFVQVHEFGGGVGVESNWRASTSMSTPAKQYFSTPLGARNRGRHVPATPQAWRGTDAGEYGATAGNVGSKYSASKAGHTSQQLLSTLGAWMWLLKAVSVQIKAHQNQAEYMKALLRDLFIDPRAPSRMIQVLKAAMNVKVPEPEDVSEYARDLFAYMSASGSQGWATYYDENGTELFNLEAAERACRQYLFSQTAAARIAGAVPRAGEPATPAAGGGAGREALVGAAESQKVLDGVMQLLLTENRKRRVFSVQMQVVKAWVDTTSVAVLCVIDAFGSMTVAREILIDLLTAVREFLLTSPVHCREHLSKAFLLLLTVLNRIAVPSDLDASISEKPLEAIVETILDADSNPVVRGNMYASLMVHLGFTTTDPLPTDLSASILARSVQPQSGSMLGRTVFGASMSRSMAAIDPMQLQAKDSAVRLLAKQGGSNMLRQLLTDAQTGGIWQSVALSVLDVFCQWSVQAGGRAWVHEFIHSQGYVTTFVDMVRAVDPALTAVTSSIEDPEQSERNQVSIYESLMGLLQRLSMHRQSRSMLIEAGLVLALAECACFTYRVGSGSDAATHSMAVSTSRMDIDGTSPVSRQVDPYQYFAGLLPESRVSETLVRYNQVLTPALDLLAALVSLHPVQVAPGASAGSAESTSILVKSTTQFLEVHGGSMTRIVRAAASLLSHRPPDDDHALEVAILHQAKQIACITRFLVRTRAPVSPDLTSALLDVFVQGTQSEAATGKLPQRRSTITDRTLLHALADVVNLCFTRVFERPANAELSGSRFMFDLDLSVAQNKYYAQRTRPSLGSLALFVHQVLAQHRATRASLKDLGARLADGVAARGSTTINDWNKYVLCGRTSQDVAIQVQYQSVPEAKRAEMIQNRMISMHRQLEIDAVSHVRMLETAMAVFILHLRHWAAGGSSLAEVAQQQQQQLQQQASGARGSGRGGFAQRAARQMSSAIRKDAQDVFGGLQQAIEAVEWADEEANAKRVLVELCKQSADLIAGFPQ